MGMQSVLTLGLVTAALFIAPVSNADATAVTVGQLYQEGSSRVSKIPPTAASCNGNSSCRVLFNVVPAGKQLLITHVFCRLGAFNTVGADGVRSMELVTYGTNNQPTDRVSQLALMLPSTLTAQISEYRLGGEVRQLLKAGERPVLYFQATQPLNWDAYCTISGKVGNPPID